MALAAVLFAAVYLMRRKQRSRHQSIANNSTIDILPAYAFI